MLGAIPERASLAEGGRRATTELLLLLLLLQILQREAVPTALLRQQCRVGAAAIHRVQIALVQCLLLLLLQLLLLREALQVVMYLVFLL